ncbi:MAG TPA: chaperonin GroEL [Roseiflexaceae bacterium]|nr:chaperonin GroEL [Roseiflexaceae bacterium]
MPTPQVLFGTEARERLKEGLDLLARLISLTLGPRAGVVALSRFAKEPEVLTSSAVIARRIVEIPGRGANVGAMLLRHAIYRVNEQLGDGGATTAALAHALLTGGHKQLAAGANPMLLRQGMERGLRAAVAALQAQARPLDGERDLAGLAHAATGDPELSRVLGAIFSRLGPEGTVVVEEYAATYLAHQFFEGARWDGGLVSPAFIDDQARQQTLLTQPCILVTDHTITQPAQIVRLLEQIVQTRSGPLLILAEDVSGPARALLLSNRERGVLDVVAATLTIEGSHRRHSLEDIAIITDAYFVAKDQGDRLESVGIGDLGRARLVQVGTDKIAIVGGAGQQALIDQRRRVVRAQMALAEDEQARRKLIERLGKLAGGMAVLKLGASSDSERAVRKEQAQRFIQFMPVALEEGVVPGGGAAYLACQPALDRLADEYTEEAIGTALVRDALAAPLTWLVRNAGLHPAPILAEARRRGTDYGYDVLGEQLVDMWSANILDAAKVTRVALETAVSVAAMTLTTEAIVLRRKPSVSLTP